LAEFKEAMKGRSGDKHLICFDAINGTINLNLIEVYCQRIDERKGEIDFEFIILIRLLYLLAEPTSSSVAFSEKYQSDCVEAIDMIKKHCVVFPFGLMPTKSLFPLMESS
jgi:hypothetical protein